MDAQPDNATERETFDSASCSKHVHVCVCVSGVGAETDRDKLTERIRNENGRENFFFFYLVRALIW